MVEEAKEKKSNFCVECGGELDKFDRIQGIPQPDGYIIPQLCVDAIVLKEKEGKKEILMIKRAKDPYKDHLAFPGGRMEYGEDPKDACLRELLEETGITGTIVKLLTVAGKPDRDPRGHCVSIVYIVKPKNVDELPKPATDAKEAVYITLQDVMNQKLAFDHNEILKQLE